VQDNVLIMYKSSPSVYHIIKMSRLNEIWARMQDYYCSLPNSVTPYHCNSRY